MTKDAVDYVRQGAFIALAMVLVQRSEKQEPEVAEFRKTLEKIIEDKHEDTMTKFGCIIAEGIVNAGGRNVTLALHAPSGHKRMAACVGMAMFSQYWYWYPLVPMLSLAFSPTSVIGLNKDLNMPVISMKSNAPPELFAYPPMKEEKKKDLGPAAPTAVLSITEKAKKRELKRTKSQGGMDVDKEGEDKDGEKKEEKKEGDMDVDKEGEDKDGEKKEEKEEEKPTDHEIVQNPARVTIPQRQFITFDQDDRYVPVRPGAIATSGIILLTDTKPDEEQHIVENSIVAPEGDEPEGDEPDPPEPFEYTEHM